MDMNLLFGTKIIENKHLRSRVPKIQLGDHIQCTAEFRAKYNKWLLEFFGEVDVAYAINVDALTSLVHDPIMKMNELYEELNPRRSFGTQSIVMAPSSLAVFMATLAP